MVLSSHFPYYKNILILNHEFLKKCFAKKSVRILPSATKLWYILCMRDKVLSSSELVVQVLRQIAKMRLSFVLTWWEIKYFEFFLKIDQTASKLNDVYFVWWKEMVTWNLEKIDDYLLLLVIMQYYPCTLRKSEIGKAQYKSQMGQIYQKMKIFL